MDSEVRDRFKYAIRNHRMAIEMDNGVHRSIHFAAPGTSIYSFRLVTWPGHLAISGDLDDFIFCRLRDMFDFFRYAGPEYDCSDGPNYGYWAEKAQAVARHGGLEGFSEDLYENCIRRAMAEHISGMSLSDAKQCIQDARLDDLFDAPLSTHEAITKAQDWRSPITDECPFSEFWDYRLTDYTFGYKFACHAIQWGIKQYDLHKQGRDQSAHDKRVLEGAQ